MQYPNIRLKKKMLKKITTLLLITSGLFSCNNKSIFEQQKIIVEEAKGKIDKYISENNHFFKNQKLDQPGYIVAKYKSRVVDFSNGKAKLPSGKVTKKQYQQFFSSKKFVYDGYIKGNPEIKVMLTFTVKGEKVLGPEVTFKGERRSRGKYSPKSNDLGDPKL